MFITLMVVGALYVVGLSMMLPVILRMPDAEMDSGETERGGD